MIEFPLVSVLMTAFNREKFIAEAIESVLDSTYSNFELILVDDCSSDSTLKIANEYARNNNKIKVFLNDRNLGDYPNRNKAASYAKGKYIKYLDSDDIMYPNCLEIMITTMEKFPEAIVGISQNNPNPNLPYPILSYPLQTYLSQYFSDNILLFGPTASIIRRDLFLKEGGYSEMRHDGDSLTNLRISAKYPIVLIQPGLIWWRKHPQQENMFRPKKYMYYDVLLQALNNPNCPLSENEIKNAKQKIKRQRQILKLMDFKKMFFNILSFKK